MVLPNPASPATTMPETSARRTMTRELSSAIAEVAARVGVDPKTVERWIVLGRIPHRSHRWATASLLGTDEAYLWPELADQRRTQAASTSELVTLYPNRGAVPGALWRSLLEPPPAASTCWSMPGCSCRTAIQRSPSSLPPRPSMAPRCAYPRGSRLRRGAAAGEEEQIGDGLAARVRLGLLYLRDAIGAPGVELRFHATTLYNSIYRFDDDLLVNAHVYGAPAAHSPVLHLRRLPGGQLVDHYQASFERVWEQASTDNVPAVLAQEGR
jgi:hypothetical protein